ncbi:hypothetical protein [Halomicrococcus sp. SG-WS-1]|uniref:hypothetical protein n=1 Tax=Halomicrococcus sp. SG-WS-1 TaxID=3439057 RepID=UPI003F7A4F22
MGIDELFTAFVTALVGAVILLAVNGSDPSWLINLLPKLVMIAFVISIIVGIVGLFE